MPKSFTVLAALAGGFAMASPTGLVAGQMTQNCPEAASPTRASAGAWHMFVIWRTTPWRAARSAPGELVVPQITSPAGSRPSDSRVPDWAAATSRASTFVRARPS